MKRIIRSIVIIALCAAVLAPVAVYLVNELYVPAEWVQLQRWAATAEPGAMLRNNLELTRRGGKNWQPVHTQTTATPFLYSDSPEYLHNETIGKGLACMRLTRDARYRQHPEKPFRFGVGMHHINKTADPLTGISLAQPVQILIRLAPSVTDGGKTCANTQSATVRMTGGAFGTSKGMAVFAGKNCVRAWFTKPNVPVKSITLKPGEAAAIFTHRLGPDSAINGRFELEATNAYFLKVYTAFGKVRDPRNITFAPYEMTIGTNSGTGRYWERTLRPAPGTHPFDASNTRRSNKIHYRFERVPPYKPGMQYLVDETWDLRPENLAKEKIRAKGGKVRRFKGDYNVDYTVVIPVRSGSGKPCWFAIVDLQHQGIFGGAVKMADGRVVEIPPGPDTLIERNEAGEGVLLGRVCVRSRTPVEYKIKWMLPGGSHGDQEFMLVPLGEQPKK